MKNNHILAGKLHFFAVENVAVLKTDIILFVEEALLLNAGHVKHVELVDYGVEAFYNFILNTGRLKNICNQIVRNRKLLRTYENVFISFEMAKGFGKGVNGAAKLKVAAEAYGVVLKPPQQLADCYQVGEGLGRVVVAAISRVDNRAGRILACQQCRTLFWSSHCNYVGIA